MNGNFIHRLMWGLFVIFIGVALMLRQSGYAHFDIGTLFSVYWPVILLFLGFQALLQRMAYGKGNSFGSGMLIVLGCLFLGKNLGWFDWTVGDVLKFAGPIVLIIFGLTMIFKPKPKRAEAESHDDEWKAYTYRPTEEPVPPAPPLHPDPTKGGGVSGQGAADDEGTKREGSERAGAVRDGSEREGFVAPSESGSRISTPPPPIPPGAPSGHASGQWQNRSYYREGFGNQERTTSSIPHKRLNHWEKHALRAEKIRERIERRHQHHMRHYRKDRVEWWNHDPNAQTRSGFIGDIYLGQDYWELKPMNISHFIGDTVLDLTKAQIMPGETVINISSFIGDVKVYLPNDLEIGIHVVSSAFVGDVAVLGNKEGGIFKNVDVETPLFQETDKKIRLHVSTFIGDVRVTKVG